MTHPLESYPVAPRGADLPYDDGEPMDSARHRDQMLLLIETLSRAWADRNDFYVGGNMFVYYSETQARKNDFRGPDVFVVLGAERRERKSWVVWEEGGLTPDVIIELTSPSTEHVDRTLKKDLYARALRVNEYYIFDPWTKDLDGYTLDAGAKTYRSKSPDEQGRLSCDALGLMLGLVPGRYLSTETEWLRWIDQEGRTLPTGEEDAQIEHVRAEQEKQRAEQEKQRAEQEKQRADKLAAELEEYRRR